MKRLEEKVVVAIGAANGVGESIVSRLAEEGASLLVCGNPDDPINEIVDSVTTRGGQALPFFGDLTTEESVKDCIEFTISVWGRIDILLHLGHNGHAELPTEQYPVKSFDRVTETLRSIFLTTRFALTELQKTKGCIIVKGSLAGEKGYSRNTIYGASAGFIQSFVKSIGQEQASFGVRANCVCFDLPDAGKNVRSSRHRLNKRKNRLEAVEPSGSNGNAEQVARVIAFLASEEASFLTGEMYSVEDGLKAIQATASIRTRG